MSSASSIQTKRIARLLDAPAEDLAFLERLEVHSLRTLHDQIIEVIFDPDAGRLGTLQAAARMLPPPITAKVAERALGPVLAGRLAGSIDDGTAAAIARRMPPEFLADVAGQVHPGRVEAVVGRLQARQVEAATDVLISRDDLLVLGRFAGMIPVDTLQSIVGRMDAGTILDVAPFVEPIDRVDHLIGFIDDPILLAVLRTAHTDRRWVDALDVVDSLGGATRTRIAEIAVPEAELIDGAVRSAVESDRWPALLSFAVLAGNVPDRHWVDVDALADVEVIEAVVESTDRHGLWESLTTVVSFWPTEMRERVAPNLDAEVRGRLGL